MLGFSLFYYRNLEQEYAHIGNVAVLLVGMVAFMLLCRCKHNLSDSQYLSVLCIIMTFISLAMPDAKENLVVGILVSLMFILSGMLFFYVRVNAPSSVRIGALMLLYCGVSSIISEIFQK
jgi:hypothetical protein